MAKKPFIRLPWKKKAIAPEAPLAAQAPVPIELMPAPERIVMAMPTEPTSPTTALLEDGRTSVALAGLALLGIAAVAQGVRKSAGLHRRHGAPNRQRYDKKAYRFYTIDQRSGLIVSGWEYRDDAREDIVGNMPAPRSRWTVKSRRELLASSIDPRSNARWLSGPVTADTAPDLVDGSAARHREIEAPSQSDLNENAVIGWDRHGGYTLAIEGRFVASGEKDEVMRAYRAWCTKHKYRPTLYEVNDHGNVTELDWYGRHRPGREWV